MKRPLQMAVTFLVLLCGVGCGATNKAESKPLPFVGKWKADLPEGKGFVELTFHSDGQMESFSSATGERKMEKYTIIDPNTIETVEEAIKREFGKPTEKQTVRHRLRLTVDGDILSMSESGMPEPMKLKRVK